MLKTKSELKCPRKLHTSPLLRPLEQSIVVRRPLGSLKELSRSGESSRSEAAHMEGLGNWRTSCKVK